MAKWYVTQVKTGRIVEGSIPSSFTMDKTIEEQIKELEDSLTGDMMSDMEIKDKIHALNMESKGVSCSVDDPDCEACGS